jgi:phage tail sheath gpL-like
VSVAFNRMPTNLRVPFFYAEVNSGLSFFSGNSKHLIIGQKQAAGTAAVNVPAIVQTSQIEGLYGAASMMTAMIYTAKLNNPDGEIWALPVADPAGTAATGSITIAGTPTPGILTVYIAGQAFTVAVSAIDTPTTLAAALSTAINAGFTDINGHIRYVGVTAAPTAGVVALTSVHIGALGNNIQVDKDLVGNEGPNAALITIVPMASGAGIPVLTSALAGCGAIEFDMISFPYADATSLATMQAFLNDAGGRWDPTQDIYGHAFTVLFGNLSAQTTLGLTRNDPHVSIMGVQASPTPPWIWAAAITAQVQLHKNLGADLTQAGEISRPMQTLELLGVLPPKLLSQYWLQSDRQSLYFDGISGFFVTRDKRVVLDRVVTTYQTNVWGSPDTTFLDIETMYQTMYTLRYLRQVITQTYPRSALVPDNPGALQGFTTPTDIKATIVNTYANLVFYGVMKRTNVFADNVVVEQASDPNRVNVYLPLDVVNQLRIFAANATVFLNAAAAVGL